MPHIHPYKGENGDYDRRCCTRLSAKTIHGTSALTVFPRLITIAKFVFKLEKFLNNFGPELGMEGPFLCETFAKVLEQEGCEGYTISAR